MTERQTERECALCKRRALLVNSHLIPAAFYKILRKENEAAEPGDPNPIHITTEAIWQTSKQMTAHLLCSECEDRFSRLGEKYAVEQALRASDDFPLADKLARAAPIQSDAQGEIYATRDITDLDTQKLLYFSASIFWRASVRRWRVSHTKSIRLHLDKYSEGLRRFLLGESEMPETIAIHLFVDRKREARVIATPAGARDGAYHRHSFIVPGMQFMMFVGKGVPADNRAHALGPAGILFSMDVDQSAMFRNAVVAMRSARVSAKMAALAP